MRWGGILLKNHTSVVAGKVHERLIGYVRAVQRSCPSLGTLGVLGVY